VRATKTPALDESRQRRPVLAVRLLSRAKRKSANCRLSGMRKRTVIWLSDDACLVIKREACRRRLLETGGPLLGYKAGDGSVVIDAVRGPGPRAHHARFHYRPDREAIQAAIDEELLASEGHRYLVGEWHSHPLGRSGASSRDNRSLSEMAEDREVGLSRPVALIQATKPWGRRVRASELSGWLWEPGTAEVLRAELRRFSVPP
jgi:integrative and conjugative element protein (TIGR02256 family)